VIGAPPEIYKALLDFYSYAFPGAFFAPAHQLWLANKRAAKAEGDPDREVDGWDGKIRLMHADSGKVPAGLFRATWKEAEAELGIKFQIKFNRPAIAPFKLGFSEPSQKYKFQNSCVDAMLGAMHRGGGIVLSATASGKTKTTAQFFSKLSCTVLFIVDQLDLLYQSQEELGKWLGEEVGVVGDQTFEPQRVTVATIQTLQKHHDTPKFKAWYRTIDVMVVDELHKAMAKRNFKLLQQIRPTAVYGLTATLALKKKDVRYKAFAFAGPVLFQFPIKEAMKQKVVATGRVVQILFPALEDPHKDPAEAYREETIECKDKLLAVRAIVDDCMEKGKYVMVLADRVAHVQALDEAMHDFAHATAYGAIKREKRKSDRDLFEMGDIRCLIANRVYEKGVNIKRADIGIDVAELPSQTDCVQKFGRMTRLHEDKDSFIYIDFGTYGDKHRSRAARARASAFRREGLQVKVIKIKAPVGKQAELAKRLVARELARG
jgi:superfamily II DNA or RNA helicase